MALINRFSRLLKADLHAVLDRIEEPEQLLRQSVREMETALAADEQRQRLLTHEREQLQSRRDALARALAGIGEELDVCFRAGNEALARSLVRRRIERERLQEQLSHHADRQDRELGDLQQRLGEHRARLDSMRQKLDLLAPDEPGDGQGEPLAMPRVDDADVEVAYLRELQKRSAS